MSQNHKMSLVRRLSQAGTILHTWLHGQKVGNDALGNIYYKARKTAAGQRERRWVMYVDEPEASLVPPEWHGWLHHTLPAPLTANDSFHKPWQKPHQPNLTGTAAAYFPPGHSYKGAQRPATTSDYEAWKPE